MAKRRKKSQQVKLTPTGLIVGLLVFIVAGVSQIFSPSETKDPTTTTTTTSQVISATQTTTPQVSSSSVSSTPSSITPESSSQATTQTSKQYITSADISDYSGQKNIVLNNNSTNLNYDSFYAELGNSNFSLTNLDSLNRAGIAKAILSPNTYRGSEDREENSDISSIKPTGWKNKRVDGSYIYNRSHLIGYSLIDANTDTPLNLITGTRSFNADTDWGMLHYENLVRDAVKSGKTVMYVVNPIFKDNELVARGVQMMAKSTDGSFEFNVFIYNVQDNITINYADGTSTKS